MMDASAGASSCLNRLRFARRNFASDCGSSQARAARCHDAAAVLLTVSKPSSARFTRGLSSLRPRPKLAWARHAGLRGNAKASHPPFKLLLPRHPSSVSHLTSLKQLRASKSTATRSLQQNFSLMLLHALITLILLPLHKASLHKASPSRGASCPLCQFREATRCVSQTHKARRQRAGASWAGDCDA